MQDRNKLIMGMISALVLAVVQLLALYKIYVGTETVSTILSIIFGVLTAAGIITAPFNLDSEKDNANEDSEDKSNDDEEVK